jgi:DNA-binding MarR family transcriptional regulator
MGDRFQNFTVLTLNVHRCIQKIKTEEMAEFDLKAPHVSCLYYLYKNGPLTATELCEICLEDKSYVSHSLKFLEANGYVRCDSSAKKRYNAPLTLTEKGYELSSRMVEKIDRVLESASCGIDDADREIFYRALSTISNNLEAICEKYNQQNIKDE